MVVLVIALCLAFVGALVFIAHRRGVGSTGNLTPEERERGLTAEEKARAIHQQTHWRRL
ncbi:hypothetical protein [Streptomyces spirodelae]|uniref:Uncharacterized protein n=1 Tax=Streptomyces spirodelae TaxID=2812904 RepID=A0ABS3WXN3_9ACTN|nr:hypothetical protein [Streptomyces spirodelae]MBO8187895.1 hypothetical protein [Streptomyces spirodelae]